MTFTQIDDNHTDSPAVLNVSRSARHLLTEAYVYCNRQLTDGFITRAQWLRATDTEAFDVEVEELIRERLVSQTRGGYQLDWRKQQTREQVERGRERRRLDNERRTKSLALHQDGDHSLCTHEGGGLHRGRSMGTSTHKGAEKIRSSSGRSVDGVSSGPSTNLSRASSASSGPSAGHAPTHPNPTRNGVEGGLGDAGAGTPRSSGPHGPASGSAGATPPASPGRRTMADGFVVTAAMLGGVDPNSLDMDGVEGLMGERMENGFIDSYGRVLEQG